MKKLIQIIKSLNFKQVLTAFLAGSLLVISTACSDGNVAQSGGKAYTDTANKSMSDTYDKYDANQSFEGGMNNYNDDPRYDTKAGADTKTLVDRAKSRQTDDLGEYFGNIGDRAGDRINDAKRDVPRTINARKEDTVRDVQQRTDTLKNNLKNAPGEAKKVFEGAKDTAGNAINDATNGAARITTDEIKGNIKDVT